MPEPTMRELALQLLALRAKATPGPWEADNYGGYVWGKGMAMVADESVRDAANPWEVLLRLYESRLDRDYLLKLSQDPQFEAAHEAIEIIQKGHEPAIRMRGVGAALPIDQNRALICAAVNAVEALAGFVLVSQPIVLDPASQAEILELKHALTVAHQVFAAESDARKADYERAWLEGAREMYLDITKVFPLTAPAGEYAKQLLNRIRE